MFTKIGKFDKLPPGPKDSVPTDTISKTQPVGEDDGKRGQELARGAKHPGRRDRDDATEQAGEDRAYVSLAAVRQFIGDRLKSLAHDAAGAEEPEDREEKPALDTPLTVQSRAAVAYRLAQQAAPVAYGRRDDNLPVSADAGVDEKTRLEHELSRVETLQAAGYDRIPVAEGQTFLQALEIAYTALEARR